MRKNLILIFLCSIAAISGCSVLSFSESASYDPISHAFPTLPCYLQKKTADEHCNYVTSQLGSTALLPDHELQIEAQQLLNKVLSTYQSLSKSTSTFAIYRNHFLYQLPPLRIKIFSIQEPLAASYPNGEIHFSKSFFDGSSPHSAKNTQQKIALIAHEVIHILHGHLCYQWRVADSYNQFVRKKSLHDLTKLTTLLPISYTNTLHSTRNLSELANLGLFMEFNADFGAILLLDAMGIDIIEYSNLLEGLLSYHVQKENQNPISYFDNSLWHRIRCIKNTKRIETANIPEFLAVQFSSTSLYGNKYTYSIFSTSIYPKLRHFIGYWACALPVFGIQPWSDKFIIYGNGMNQKLSTRLNPKAPINTNNGPIYPEKISLAIILPYKYLGVPIFSFIK